MTIGGYPDTTYDADPRAPWNAPRVPGICDGCEHMASCRLKGGGEIFVCVEFPDDVVEVYPDDPACEMYAVPSRETVRP